MKKKYNLILTFLGFALLFVIVYRVGILNVFNVFSKINLLGVFVAILFFALAQIIRVWKWVFMNDVVALGSNPTKITNFYFQTRLMGLITPFRSGEVIPTIFEEENKDKFLSITLVDRFYESLTTVIVIVAAFFFFFSNLFNQRSLFFLGLMVFGLVVFYLIFTVESIYLFFKSFFPKNNKKLITFFDALYYGIKKNLGPKNSTILFVATFFATLVDVLLYYFLFIALNIGVTLVGACVAFSFLNLINFIAPTPSGVGVGDLGYVALNEKIRMGSGSEIVSFLILLRVLTTFLTVLFLFVSRFFVKGDQNA